MDSYKYDAVYDFVVKLKQMGKSKEEAIKELRKIRVDEEYIAPIISKVYSQEAEDSKEEQQEVKKEQTHHKQQTLSFLNTLFFFLLFISSVFTASMYAIDRLFGLSYFPYALLFTSVLFIMFLSFIFLSFKSYIKSTFFYIVSLLLTVSILGVISYFEFKPLVPGILYLFYSHYLYRQYLENLALYLLLGGGLFILYSLVLTFISKRISFKGISYKSMKKGSCIVLSLALLVIIATFLYVNVLFKEEVRVKPLSVGVAQCEGIHLSEGKPKDKYSFFELMIQMLCDWRINYIDPDKSIIYMRRDEKNSKRLNDVVEISKNILSKNTINIRNKRERNIYYFYLINYGRILLSGFTIGDVVGYMKNIILESYFYPPTKERILDKNIMDVCNYYISSFSKERYKNRKKDVLFPLTVLVDSKYNSQNFNNFLDCFEKVEDELYVVYPNCTCYFGHPFASPIYKVRQNNALYKDAYLRIPNEKDVNNLRNLMNSISDLTNAAIYNYEKISGSDYLNKLEEELKKNTYLVNKYSRYLSLDNFTIIADNKIEFSISYPSIYDDILNLDKKPLILFNKAVLSWDEKHDPFILCKKYNNTTARIEYLCTITGLIPIEHGAYNSIEIQYNNITSDQVNKLMYAYVGS